MARPFLTARWKNLILANYVVPDEILLDRLPAGGELEHYAGSAYVSLVAFDFLDTRVAGIRWPGMVNFPEINLRFYLRRGNRRGVCFVREFVPSHIIANVARTIYNEPYSSAAMTSRNESTGGRIHVTHRLHRCGREFTIAADANTPAHLPPADSREHWFKEHQWGFGATRRGVPLVYEVQHPEWEIYDSPKVQMNWDFAALYGDEWRFLNDRKPDSVVFAAGSEIAVFPKGRAQD
jgi:uncharacterized protein